MTEETKGTLSEAIGRKPIKLVDAAGAEHVLRTLTLGEVALMTDEFGELEEWGKSVRMGAAMWEAAIWLALRKAMATPAQRAAKDYALTRRQAGLMVPIGKGRATVIDADGVQVQLEPLTLADLVEIEEIAGSFFDWIGKAVSPRAAARTLWVASRKVGLTPAQVEAREWASKEEDVVERFDMAVLRDPAFKALIDADLVAGILNLWLMMMADAGIRMRDGGPGGDPTNAATPAS